MYRYKKYLILSFAFSALSLILTSCKSYDNFTTYFNTYYNTQRLISESQNEFEYQDEKRRVVPRVYAPEPDIKFDEDDQRSVSGAPPFLAEFVIDQRKLQPVKVKLDSVIIKGSKILAKHPNSNFIEKTLFLMGQSYFYSSDWLNSQIQCSELIDKFPEGDLSPDAHLMLVKNYLIRRKFYAGKVLLSRTIDIAWFKKRYDILSEAFRIEAELALYQKDKEGALKPYRQAVAQCDNNSIKAKWQLDLAALLYRMGRFKEAATAYQKVHKYSPDYVQEFEAYIYYAQSIMRIGRTEEAAELLDKLNKDGKYEEWRDFIAAARLDLYRVKNDKISYDKYVTYTDSAYANSPTFTGVWFEKAMENYNKNDFAEARKYLARTRTTRTNIAPVSNYLYQILTNWNQKRQNIFPNIVQSNKPGNVTSDSARVMLASNMFDYARIWEQLDQKDSANYYYKLAVKTSPENRDESARFVYAYSRVTKDSDPQFSDSLMEVLVEKYPRTEFGKDAMKKLGYTDRYVIDTVSDYYLSGNSLRKANELKLAIEKYNYVQTNYPKSTYAPKSLFAIGWIYEYNIKNLDSATYYYSELLHRYPKSPLAKDVKISLDYLNIYCSGLPVPDSLKPKSTKVDLKDNKNTLNNKFQRNNLSENDKLKNARNKPGSLKDALNPQNALHNAKEQLMNPTQMIKNPIDKLKNPDSFIPGIKINNPFSNDTKNGQDTTGTNKPKPAAPDSTGTKK